MRLRRATSRLAAHAGTRQVEVSIRADRTAAAVDRAVLRVWRALLGLAKRGHTSWSEAVPIAGDLARNLPGLIAREIALELERLARWSRQTAVRAIREFPVEILRSAAYQTVRPLREEDESNDLFPSFTDLWAPLRSPDPQDLDKTELLRYLFPPPTQQQVDQVIYSSGWQDRIAAGTRLASPALIAGTLARGLAIGQSREEIARDLEPIVQGVRSSAKRVARTEGLRVASAVQHQAHEQLGDLVIGWQIHATLDQNTRPEHAARSGTIYYRNPKPGQPGLDQMPHPPAEADGSTAFNCRCYLTPILSDPGEVSDFTPPEPPDPIVYRDWFDQADERRRRLAVGTRRYSAVKELLGETPAWEHFLDPDTGSLLPTADLQAETDEERAERLDQVREVLGERRRLARRGSQFGSTTEE